LHQKILIKNYLPVTFKPSQETDRKVSAETGRRVEKRKRPKGWKRRRLEKLAITKADSHQTRKEKSS